MQRGCAYMHAFSSRMSAWRSQQQSDEAKPKENLEGKCGMHTPILHTNILQHPPHAPCTRGYSRDRPRALVLIHACVSAGIFIRTCVRKLSSHGCKLSALAFPSALTCLLRLHCTANTGNTATTTNIHSRHSHSTAGTNSHRAAP